VRLVKFDFLNGEAGDDEFEESWMAGYKSIVYVYNAKPTSANSNFYVEVI
jgi:hypothetical protein